MEDNVIALPIAETVRDTVDDVEYRYLRDLLAAAELREAEAARLAREAAEFRVRADALIGFLAAKYQLGEGDTVSVVDGRITRKSRGDVPDDGVAG